MCVLTSEKYATVNRSFCESILFGLTRYFKLFGVRQTVLGLGGLNQRLAGLWLWFVKNHEEDGNNKVGLGYP